MKVFKLKIMSKRLTKTIGLKIFIHLQPLFPKGLLIVKMLWKIRIITSNNNININRIINLQK